MIKFRTLRHALMMTAATLGGTIGAVVADRPAYAQEAVRTYAIPAQDLDGALRAFAMQTGRDVLYPPQVVAGKRSPGLRGQHTEEHALRALLAGTGLGYERTPSNGYAIRSSSGPFQTGSERPASGAQETVVLPEVLVDGSRSQNSDIRRTEDDAQPYVVFDGEEIAQSGSYDLEEFLMRRLPMNAQQNTNIQVFAASNASQSGLFNLRGLGIGQTLVLVDGRRVPGMASGFDLGQGRVNGIPPSAIERIEVLPSTASGIYGGDAVGGVINIILKRDYSGLDLDVSYGNRLEGSFDRSQFGLSGSSNFNDSSTRITFALSRSEHDELLDNQTDIVRQSRALLIENNPSSIDIRSFRSNRPNVISLGGNLVLDAGFGGTSLNSPWTSVGAGSPGPFGSLGDGGAGLLARAGVLNLEGPGDSSIGASKTNAYSFGLRQDFGSNIEAFLSLSRDETHDDRNYASRAAVTLGGTSAFNPFGQTIRINVPVGSHDFSRSYATADTATVGVVFPLVSEWRGSFEYSFGRSEHEYSQRNVLGLTPAGTAYLSPLALTDNPLEIDESYFRFIDGEFGPAETTLETLSFRVSGPTIDLPGGPIRVTGLVEERRESVSEIMESSVSPFGSTITWRPEMSRDVRSYYGEARAPIVTRHNAMPFVHELELQISVRRDEYNILAAETQGVVVPSRDGPFPDVEYGDRTLSSTDYMVGISYSPVSDLTLRASLGTGFTAPGLSLLSPRTTVVSPDILSVTDPRRGNELLIGVPSQSDPSISLITLTSGGASDLKPEQSQSFSAGLIYTPSQIEGLRISVDYTEIEKTDEFYLPSDDFIVNNESVFPGRVVRVLNLPGDPSGWAGPIALIDRTALNISGTEVRAVDLQLDYTLDTDHLGAFRFYAIATYQDRFRRQLLPGDMPYDSVGHVDGPLELRGNFGLDWTRGALSAGWNAQYFDEYSIRWSDPSSLSFNDARVVELGSETVPVQTYYDGYVRFTFSSMNGDAQSASTELALSVQNIFDEDPPILTPSLGGYSTYGSPVGRTVLLSLRHHF